MKLVEQLKEHYNNSQYNDLTYEAIRDHAIRAASDGRTEIQYVKKIREDVKLKLEEEGLIVEISANHNLTFISLNGTTKANPEFITEIKWV